MKKKYVAMMLAISMLALSACGKQDNVSNQCTCTCQGCADCIYKTDGAQSSVAVEDAESVFAQESVPASEAVPVEGTQTQESTEIPGTEETTQAPSSEEKPVSELTEGEKAARKELQASLAASREELYALPNSLEKTQKINEIDKQILANNTYDFSIKSVQFLGDSITEGICGEKDADGNYISYVNYVNDYLKFANCMNNGKAGRMFSDYAGEELAFSLSMGNMFNNSADISYYRQEESFPSLKPIDYVREFYHLMTDQEIRSLLARVGLKADSMNKTMDILSGGEQTKVRLAIMSKIKANILILDEPTNHLDVNAKKELYKALNNFEGSVILVSHDPEFYDEIVDVKICLEESEK